MNCQSVRDVLPELLDSRAAATAHLEARAHLANCPDCQRELAALAQTVRALDVMPTPQPSPRLRQNFYAMLEEEKHSATSARVATVRAQRARRAASWRWVLSPLIACALLVLGFLLGRRAVPAASQAPTDDTTKREIVALREQMAQQNEKLNKMTDVFGRAILLQQQNPTNERLQDVLAKANHDTPTNKDIDNLLQALTLDPSANVRLRALQALARHADREVVRAGVIAALPREPNPLVQLELIDFLAGTQDRNATPALEKLSSDESADRSVRDAAQLALAQM